METCVEGNPAECRVLGRGIGVVGLRCFRTTSIASVVGKVVVGPSDYLGGRTTLWSSCSSLREYVRLIHLIHCHTQSLRLMGIVASSLCLIGDFRLPLRRAGKYWLVATAFLWDEGKDRMPVAQALQLLAQ